MENHDEFKLKVQSNWQKMYQVRIAPKTKITNYYPENIIKKLNDSIPFSYKKYKNSAVDTNCGK